MNNKKKLAQTINEEEMTIQANLNNIEPGDSVADHRAIETSNIIIARKELNQQTNNNSR